MLNDDLGLAGRILPVRSREMRGSMEALLTWEFSDVDINGLREYDTLGEALDSLVAGVIHARPNIVAASRKIQGLWWCGHFQDSFDGGPTIGPDLLLKLSMFNIPLFLDCYHS
jgi:hypothetical protein